MASGRDSGVRRVAAGRTVGEEPRGLRVSPVRIHRRERHGRHARDEGCRGERERVRGRTAGRTGIQGLEQDGEQQGWNERSGQAREERRKSQEGRSETSESFGVGSGGGGGGGTKRREGERVVARRGARRRRERAAGGSIHPSAAFFSPYVARTMALDAVRSLGHVDFGLPRSPSSAEEAANGLTEENVSRTPPLFFSSSPLALARCFSLQGIMIIELSLLFHSFTLFAPLFLSVLRLISKRETFIVVEQKLKKN